MGYTRAWSTEWYSAPRPLLGDLDHSRNERTSTVVEPGPTVFGGIAPRIDEFEFEFEFEGEAP